MPAVHVQSHVGTKHRMNLEFLSLHHQSFLHNLAVSYRRDSLMNISAFREGYICIRNKGNTFVHNLSILSTTFDEANIKPRNVIPFIVSSTNALLRIRHLPRDRQGHWKPADQRILLFCSPHKKTLTLLPILPNFNWKVIF